MNSSLSRWSRRARAYPRIRTRRVVYTPSLSSVGPSSHEGRGGREDQAAAPVTRAPPGGLFLRRAHRVPRAIHPRRMRGNGTAPGDGFWSKERIPGVRDACGESGKGAKKAREAFYPIARRCLFGRHTCRAGNLSSERRMGGRPSAGQWFFPRKSRLGLDTRRAT